MQFTHLSDLTGLLELDEPLVEASAKRSATADFQGISSVIDDCLNDLSEKVEQLVDLADDTGATKLDTVKDKDGLTVFKKLDKLTKEYKKAVEKLMIEAEAMVTQVAEGTDPESSKLNGWRFGLDVHNKKHAPLTDDEMKKYDRYFIRGYQLGLAGKQTEEEEHKLPRLSSMLGEGKVYGDSADFTEEFYGLHQKVNDIKSVVKSPRWMGWMKITDHNFDTNCEEAGHDVVEATDALSAAFNTLEAEFDKLNAPPAAEEPAEASPAEETTSVTTA